MQPDTSSVRYEQCKHSEILIAIICTPSLFATFVARAKAVFTLTAIRPTDRGVLNSVTNVQNVQFSDWVTSKIPVELHASSFARGVARVSVTQGGNRRAPQILFYLFN